MVNNTIVDIPTEVANPLIEKGIVKPENLVNKSLPEVEETPIDVSTQIAKTDIETAPLLTSMLKETEQKQQDVKQNIATTFGTTTGETTTPKEALTSAYETRPTVDTATALKEAQTKYGVTELTTEVQDQAIKAAEAKNVVNNLQAELDAKKQNVETTLTSRGARDEEVSALEREYNLKISKATATYAAEAAMLEALNGNLTSAQNLVTQAVNAYTADIDAEIERFDNLFSVYSDYVDELSEEEKSILETAYNDLKEESKATKEEKAEVGNLMIEYNKAGITMDDSLETAKEKASKVSKEETPDVIGSADTGYMQWNSETGKWESIAGTGTTKKNQEINQDAAEFILKLESGVLGWGAAFDAMKALHPELSNEEIDGLLGKEKRFEYEPTGEDLSQWETEAIMWQWLSVNDSLSDKEKRTKIMSAGLNPEDFGIY